MQQATRREIIQQFKERKTPRGIFAIRCAPTSETWVGSATNLDAAWNSLRFQLNAVHRNQQLLAAWRQHGEPAFTFEVLESLPDDIDPINLHDTLKDRRLAWAAELYAQLV